MPVAHFPGTGGSGPTVTDTLRVIPPNAVLDPFTTFLVGHAVALVDDAGTPTIKLCGALTANTPGLFLGFLQTLGVVPGTSAVITGRGSHVTPIILGVMTINQAVYLSSVPGEVTSIAPSSPGATSIRVGFAISSTAIVLNTDPSYVFPV